MPRGRNILNQFEQGSDEEEAVEPTQAIQASGSDYFTYNPLETFKKQISLNVRPGTFLRTELVRDKSGFNTFWP